MRKHDKRANKRTKYQPRNRIITTTDKGEREKFYAATDVTAPLGKYQLAAGTIQHPRTGLWQVWVSTNGLDLNYISAHRDKARAEAAVDTFKQFAQTDAIYDPEKVTALYTQLIAAGDAEPEPLPEATVRAIGHDILHMVIDLKR
jgi:hypothetical protein